ncbi:MAG: response regulator, partial [Gemmatimonadaceae bacterium]|nr:response regulator [Chitinophagaceae bacterium]
LDYTRAKGYRGLVAVRGDEGLSLAKKFLPMGILLDVQLPVMSGWEVMEQLKKDLATRPIPVHMMSSHQVRTKSLTQGAIDFIDKPVAFERLGEIFVKIEQALSRHPKKVLIVEENHKHAEALAFFLEGFNVASEIRSSVNEGITALGRKDVDCVILDMGIPGQKSYETLEAFKKSPGLENLPIIIFTGKNLSHGEEVRIKQYADSIVVKTANSYQRILDEVSLFLHLVEENHTEHKVARYRKMGGLVEILKGKTILITDDDVRNIFSLTKSLESYGMNVVSAFDGREALRQLEEFPKIDLVLMDMMMPEMDGYESTRRIRENPKFRNLPVIAVTAKAMTGDREKCINAGASDYITKPVDVDQLISLLRVWLYR